VWKQSTFANSNTDWLSLISIHNHCERFVTLQTDSASDWSLTFQSNS